MGKKDRRKKESSDQKSVPTRRTFLRGLWIGLGILAVAEFAGVVFGFLRPRKPLSEKQTSGVSSKPDRSMTSSPTP